MLEQIGNNQALHTMNIAHSLRKYIIETADIIGNIILYVENSYT